MKKTSLIVMVLSFLILGSLVIWQIEQFNDNYKLKVELDKTEMQSVLMESAIEIRNIGKKDTTLRTDTERLKFVTDSVITKNFKVFNYTIRWSYFNGLKETFPKLKNDTTEALKSSQLKVCTSCLISVGVVSDINDYDAKNFESSSYIVDHTPAQMLSIMGLDKSKLKYLHILPKTKKSGLFLYAIPVLFLIGLSSLFIWLLYLNHKQSKLIKQKNEFVNHLSHQFQTPLSSIKLSANLLANKKSEPKSELITIIQTEANRLENHIKTVLHWVKSDADRLHIDKKLLSITDVIEKSLKQMKPVFITNKTRINFLPSEKDFNIYADENHLQLMLFNIWENAIKHNESAVELHISYFRIDQHLIIETRDNGVGLQNELVAEKFKGLGLAYVHKIMNAHNGEMKLESKNNEGLSVQLNFPKADD
ncbi:sensor histidine kinase [Winogradskyella sp. PE311]|uniref:sensor histidine kinase n=1 Tax=Winogradskyella sp. PE311 TaxID=3366943 RepID=UPI003980C137